ncbi:hypothetical protein CL176_05440 [Suicoccus acidiformans]|uniref:DUF2382 domain-containing protein n=1 Tax=Suicoccus acidiformans TaxID=2036206 RepID=A0A347WK78_9LACT|nr:hypothetical protein CL176_05440 [Suicoccus acidiformans]
MLSRVVQNYGSIIENAFVEEKIVVPLSEDEIVVDRQVEVTDEVEISKSTETSTQSVEKTERRE